MVAAATFDGGNTWQNLSAGVIPQVNGQNASATDVIIDPASASRSTGNLDILYVAFQGVGVYISTNQGQSLTEVLGNVGATNLIQNSQTVPGSPLKVADARSDSTSTPKSVSATARKVFSPGAGVIMKDAALIASSLFFVRRSWD